MARTRSGKQQELAHRRAVAGGKAAANVSKYPLRKVVGKTSFGYDILECGHIRPPASDLFGPASQVPKKRRCQPCAEGQPKADIAALEKEHLELWQAQQRKESAAFENAQAQERLAIAKQAARLGWTAVDLADWPVLTAKDSPFRSISLGAWGWIKDHLQEFQALIDQQEAVGLER